MKEQQTNKLTFPSVKTSSLFTYNERKTSCLTRHMSQLYVDSFRMDNISETQILARECSSAPLNEKPQDAILKDSELS